MENVSYRGFLLQAQSVDWREVSIKQESEACD